MRNNVFDKFMILLDEYEYAYPNAETPFNYINDLELQAKGINILGD